MRNGEHYALTFFYNGRHSLLIHQDPEITFVDKVIHVILLKKQACSSISSCTESLSESDSKSTFL